MPEHSRQPEFCQLTPADRAAILACESRCDDPRVRADRAVIIERLQRGQVLFGLRQDGRLIATLAGRRAGFDPQQPGRFPATFEAFSNGDSAPAGEAMFLYNLEVDSDAAGRTHARVLIEGAFEHARQAGCAYAVAEVPCAVDDEPGRGVRACIERHLAGGPMPDPAMLQRDANLDLYRQITGCAFLGALPEDVAGGGPRVIACCELEGWRAAGGSPGAAPTLTAERLEPRILLSATWVDADSGDLLDDATGGDDLYTGTDGADTASALEGDDTLFGGDGDDWLEGGAGDDLFHDSGAATGDADTYVGGAGSDTLSYADAQQGVTVDLSTGTGPGGDTFTGIERVIGSDHDDTFAFASPQDGAVYTIAGGAGDNTIDLGNFDSSQVSFSDGTLNVTLDDGGSFSIQHEGIQTVNFADTTAEFLDGDAQVDEFSGSRIFVDGDQAFQVSVDGPGQLDLSYDADSDTLSLAGSSGTNATTTLAIDDLAGGDLTIDSVTLDSDLAAVRSNVDIQTLEIHHATRVDTITVGDGDGRIGALHYTGGGQVADHPVTVNAHVDHLAAFEFRADFTVNGDLGHLQMGDDLTSDMTFTVNGNVGAIEIPDDIWNQADLVINGDAGSITIGGDIQSGSTLTVSGSVTSLDVGNLTAGPIQIGGDAGAVTVGQQLGGNLRVDGTLGTLSAGQVTGDVTIAGDVDRIQVQADGIGDDFRGNLAVGGDLNTLQVGDDIEGSVSIDGNAGTISAGDDLKGGGAVTIGGDVGSITAGDVITKDISVGGNLDSLQAGTSFSGTLVARAVSGDLTIQNGGTVHNESFDLPVIVEYDGATDTLSSVSLDFSAATDGQHFIVSTGGTLDLSGYARDSVTFAYGRLQVDLPDGGSFTIEHDGLDTVQLADGPVRMAVWDGGAADGDWSDPANWSGDALPGPNDILVFDGTSGDTAILDAGFGGEVGGILIGADFSGQVRIESGLTVHGDLDIGGGHVVAGGGDLQIDGNLAVTGGTLTASSGVTTVHGSVDLTGGSFAHNNGTLRLAGDGANTLAAGGAQFHNLDLQQAGGSLQVTDALTIRGSLTQGGVPVDASGSDLTLIGNATVTTSEMRFGDVTFNASTVEVTGVMDIDGDVEIRNLYRLNGDQVTVAGDITTTDTSYAGSATIVLDGGGDQVIHANGGVGELHDFAVDKSSGTVTLQDKIHLSGDVTITQGTIDATAATVEFQGNNAINAPGLQLGDVIFNTSTVEVTGTLDIDGDVEIRNLYRLNGGEVTVAGDITTTDTSYAGSATIVLDGNGDQVVHANGGVGELHDFAVDKSSGTVTLQDRIQFSGDVTVTAGQLDARGATIEFQHNNRVDATEARFGDVIINTGTMDLNGDLVVEGDLEIRNLYRLNGGTVYATGEVNIIDANWGGSGTLINGWPNGEPLADAGFDQDVGEDDVVTLDATGSTRFDPDDDLTFNWKQVDGPVVTLDDPTAARPTFASPDVQEPTVLVFEVEVYDGFNTRTDTVEVVVNPVNHVPDADAGVDQTVAEEGIVTLDATGSSDPDVEDDLRFDWKQIDGPVVTLDDPTAARPTFEAPAVDEPTVLVFQVDVSDGETSRTDTVDVTVHPPTKDVLPTTSKPTPGFSTPDSAGQAPPDAVDSATTTVDQTSESAADATTDEPTFDTTTDTGAADIDSAANADVPDPKLDGDVIDQPQPVAADESTGRDYDSEDGAPVSDWDGTEDLRILDPAAAIDGVESDARFAQIAQPAAETAAGADPQGEALPAAEIDVEVDVDPQPAPPIEMPVGLGGVAFDDVFADDTLNPDAPLAELNLDLMPVTDGQVDDVEDDERRRQSVAAEAMAEDADERERVDEPPTEPAVAGSSQEGGFWPMLWGLLRGRAGTQNEERRKE